MIQRNHERSRRGVTAAVAAQLPSPLSQPCQERRVLAISIGFSHASASKYRPSESQRRCKLRRPLGFTSSPTNCKPKAICSLSAIGRTRLIWASKLIGISKATGENSKMTDCPLRKIGSCLTSITTCAPSSETSTSVHCQHCGATVSRLLEPAQRCQRIAVVLNDLDKLKRAQLLRSWFSFRS